MGSTVYNNKGILKISVKSSPEFGLIKNITIKKGVIGEIRETDHVTLTNLRQFDFMYKIEVYISQYCYYRCEVEYFENGDNRIFSLSNPIWFQL